MGKMVKLGAAALSMLWIFLMLVWVQAQILFVQFCIRRKQKRIATESDSKTRRE